MNEAIMMVEVGRSGIRSIAVTDGDQGGIAELLRNSLPALESLDRRRAADAPAPAARVKEGAAASR